MLVYKPFQTSPRIPALEILGERHTHCQSRERAEYKAVILVHNCHCIFKRSLRQLVLFLLYIPATVNTEVSGYLLRNVYQTLALFDYMFHCVNLPPKVKLLFVYKMCCYEVTSKVRVLVRATL